MTEPEDTLRLAADFAPAKRDDWLKLVATVLKGTPLERLNSTTYDMLSIEPLAQRRPGTRPLAPRAGAGPWQIIARIEHPDPGLANKAALHELENGATGLSLVFAGAVGDYGFGLPAHGEALARALDGIDSGAAAIELDLSPHAEAAIDAALAKGFAFAAPAGVGGKRGGGIRLGHDPLGAMAISGGAARRWSEAGPHFARRLAALGRNGFNRHLAAADGRVIHNAGGSESQELAFVLAVALAYLRALEAEGVALEDARRMIFFRLAADADQFLTVVKFRSLRKLWARIETACGLTPEPAFVSAETAWRMMAQRDPHVNILRTTIAVFAAALGGADAVGVLPFTAASGLPDDLARRIARNSQLILLEESHLDKVADPAAGSGAVEDLTDQLCHAAWVIFQEIEAAGGAAAALESGLIQGKVAATRAERTAAVARDQDALTGVSIFPAIEEAPSAVLAATPPRPPAPSWTKENSCESLLPVRLAQPFEALRDASDRYLKATGGRPKVFLAMLGTPAEFTTRAAFAKNLFEAGGIEAVSSEGGSSALAAAFKASGAALACLCGSDKTYQSEAAAAAAALKAAGVRHIYLAGRPSEREASYREAGVETFVYAGCDAVAVLEAAYRLVAP
jgi:methylmalonyl-CoA mutase